jgi:Arc/MetJ family transcription regulator
MRTHIILNEGLVAEAMRYANVKTRQELVDLALSEFVAARRRHDLHEFFNRVEIDPDYDSRICAQRTHEVYLIDGCAPGKAPH